MNGYKKIIPSQKMRIRLIQLLDFLPDSFVVRFQYRLKTGRKLNLHYPQRYTEKLQWYKLHYHNETLRKCVDKYDVREYIEEKGCVEILNECYGVFDNVADINFNDLPEVFVCKDTLAGGSTSVIVFDKRTDDIDSLKTSLIEWLSQSYNRKHPGREWPYDNKKHRVIIERYLEQENGDLADYKFFCFSGRVKCFYVRTDYAKNHLDGKMAFFDRDKNALKGVYMDYCNPSTEIPILPNEIDEMIAYAEKISYGYPHVRVDLYDVDGKIFFGEMTFYNASGYMNFIPDEFDYILGEDFVLTDCPNY